MAKLTAEDVLEMRSKWSAYRQGLPEGRSQTQLSREYHVTINTVRNALNGTTWQDIEQPAEAIASDAKASARRLLEHHGLQVEEMDPETFRKLNEDLS